MVYCVRTMEDPKPPATSRRSFLKATALGGAAALLPDGARAKGPTREPGASQPAGSPETGPFDDDERAALATLADLVLPGAGAWGAADYVEGLLASFDGETPRIYAGTVGSRGEWLPLDRVRERAWRLRIFGSDAVPHANEAVLGPVVGLRPRIRAGAREAAARLGEGATPEWVWWRLPGEFRDAFTDLVLEGALGDPVYRGNRDGAAWRTFHFEGAPLGYGTYTPPHEHPGAGAGSGPDPLGPFTRAALWVLGFFSRRIA
jgi:hypothetical protein